MQGGIVFDKGNSLLATQNFDNLLGGGKFYDYSFKQKNPKTGEWITKHRFGSKFKNSIKHKLYLRSSM